jgi:SLT domain-containing protein
VIGATACARSKGGGRIDIHHLYATAALAQERTMVVFASANNDRAMVLLNAAPGTA